MEIRLVRFNESEAERSGIDRGLLKQPRGSVLRTGPILSDADS